MPEIYPDTPPLVPASGPAPTHDGVAAEAFANQFGAQQVTTVKEDELCVPSRTAAQ